MLVPTYAEHLGEDLLGPTISVVYGRGIFDDAPSDSEADMKLSIDDINKQLEGSSKDSIVFLPASPMEDLPFEEFKKSSQKHQ